MVEDSKAAEKRRRAEALRANLRRRKAAATSLVEAAAGRSGVDAAVGAGSAGTASADEADKRG